MRLERTTKVFISCLMMTTMMISGCRSNAANHGNENASGTSAVHESAGGGVAADGEKLEPYEVVMVYPDGPQEDNDKVQEAMNVYLKEAYPELNVSVKLNPIDWGAWGDKTNLMFASNEKFDLIFTANWFGPYDVLVNKGALLPLDDLLKQYGPDIEAVEKDFHGGAIRNGKIYGIHTHQELGGQQGIIVRKDLSDKYNFDLSAIKQIGDIEPMLAAIKENEPGVTPMVGPNFPLDFFFRTGSMDLVIEPVGLEIANNDLKVVNMYETTRYMELARLTHKWYKLGYINKDAATQGMDGDSKLKAKTGFAIVGADVEILKDNESPQLMPGKSIALGLDIIQIPLSMDGLRTAKLAATMQGISRTSEDPARAMMLLNLFFKDKKLLTLFNFGIEGEHYVLRNGQVALPTGLTADKSKFYHDIMWQIGNQFLNVTRVGEDPDKYKNYEAFNGKTAEKKSKMLGFVFNSEPVKSEIIALDNVRRMYDPGLKAGMLDPEVEVPNLIKRLKQAGLDKVIAEAQKQLDEWAAVNEVK